MIAHTADVCAELAGWRKEDLFSDRLDDICRLVDEIRAEEDASEDLCALLKQLPPEMTIEEAHLFLSARNDDDRVRVLTAMATRLGQPEPDTSLIPERVQVMTMHGAKGLSAKVVFIPGSRTPRCQVRNATPTPASCWRPRACCVSPGERVLVAGRRHLRRHGAERMRDSRRAHRRPERSQRRRDRRGQRNVVHRQLRQHRFRLRPARLQRSRRWAVVDWRFLMFGDRSFPTPPDGALGPGWARRASGLRLSGH
jgi:hypothetical protein